MGWDGGSGNERGWGLLMKMPRAKNTRGSNSPLLLISTPVKPFILKHMIYIYVLLHLSCFYPTINMIKILFKKMLTREKKEENIIEIYISVNN